MNTVATKKIRIKPENVVLWLEMTIFMVGLVAYIYFILLSTMQVVLRQELVVSIQETETKVSELEATYFAQVNTLTPETASEYGLVAVKPVAYVTVASGDRLTRKD